MHKQLKLSLTLLSFLICAVFITGAAKAYAAESRALRFLNVDDEGEMLWFSEEYIFEEGIGEEEIAYELFTDLLEKGSCFPEGVQVDGVVINNGLLRLNLSKQMKNGGGTASERTIINQILCTAASLSDVTTVTILIENKLQPLAEGSLIMEEPVIPSETAVN